MYAQQDMIDSLKKELEVAEVDSTKVKTILLDMLKKSEQDRLI